MDGSSVHQTEIRRGIQALDLLGRSASYNTPAILSYLANGKWHTCPVALTNASEQGLLLALSDNSKNSQKLQINQPVGITFQLDFQKIIFESTVLGYDSAIASAKHGNILIESPDKIELMQRRAYQRQPVPQDLNVHVLFWHRGYARQSRSCPKDSYWQGKLLNLSAGGAHLAVNSALADDFSHDQLIGLQFTPLPCQRPALIEAQIIHFQPQPEQGLLTLGVEFLGLEACVEGRQILHRLLDIVCQYESMNQQHTVAVH